MGLDAYLSTQSNCCLWVSNGGSRIALWDWTLTLVRNLIVAYGLAMADPGSPQGGGANSPGGRQHTILPIFLKNCMKLKEFESGGRTSRPP